MLNISKENCFGAQIPIQVLLFLSHLNPSQHLPLQGIVINIFDLDIVITQSTYIFIVNDMIFKILVDVKLRCLRNWKHKNLKFLAI